MPLSLWIFALVFILSFVIRIPIAFGMVVASALYFVIEGLDLSTVAEVMVFGSRTERNSKTLPFKVK